MWSGILPHPLWAQSTHRIMRNIVLSRQVWGWFVMQQQITETTTKPLQCSGIAFKFLLMLCQYKLSQSFKGFNLSPNGYSAPRKVYEGWKRMAQPSLSCQREEVSIREIRMVQGTQKFPRSPLHVVFKLWSFKFKLSSLYQGDLDYIRAPERRVFHFLQNKYSSFSFSGADPEEKALIWVSGHPGF